MSSTDSFDNLTSLGNSDLRNISKGHIQMQVSVSLLIQFVRRKFKVFTTSKVELDNFLADIEWKGSESLVFWNDLNELLKVQQSCLKSIFCNHLSLLWHGIPSRWIFRVSYDHFSRRNIFLRGMVIMSWKSIFIEWENFRQEFQVF